MPPASVAATATPSPSPATPTPIVDPVFIDVPRAAYTIVCESWGTAPPRDAIDCSLAVEVALAALGEDVAASVRRFDVRYGDPCVPAVACRRQATARTIYAISESFESSVIRVVRDASGDISVWPPVDAPPMRPASFTRPGARAPALGPGTPIELTTRDPLPFCGRESMNVQDAFDADARRCFLQGVLAWSPVEFISIDASGENGVITHVLRYTGRGAIDDYVRTPTGWSAKRCAIEPIDTIAVFLTSPPCEPLELA